MNLKNLVTSWFTLSVICLIIVNISIILDINYLRQVLPFIYFTTFPGMILLTIIKLKDIEFLKKVVLSIGLSLFIIMSLSLLINSFYPFLSRPISLNYILSVFNIVILLFLVVSYKINGNIKISNIFNYKIDFEKKHYSILLFPLLFPFLAVLGTYLMNNTEENIILLALLVLIPTYIIIISILKKKVSNNAYPIALWTISLSLLFMNSLTSNNLMGRDIHLEFYSFNLVLNNFHWSITSYYNEYNACLSITLLPAFYEILSKIGPEYVFKIYFAIIGSFTPLSAYLVSKNFLKKEYAFYASLFIIFQLAFIYSQQSSLKTLIATFLLSILILVIIDKDFKNFSKKLLIILFLTSIILSHYSTSYVVLIILAGISIYTLLMKKNKKTPKLINLSLVILMFIIIFFWYGQVTELTFDSGIGYFTNTFTNLGNFFVSDLRDESQLSVVGLGLKSIPNIISVIIHNISFLIIGIGLLSIIKEKQNFIKKFGEEFYIGSIAAAIILFLFLFLPYVSTAYGGNRLFLQLSLFLAPIFVIGCLKTSQMLKIRKMNIVIILILLTSLFTCSTYLQYHIYGIPYSPNYENSGALRDGLYIYDSEPISVEWIYNNSNQNLTIFTDGMGHLSFYQQHGHKIRLKKNFFLKNESINEGYIYLRHVNVEKGIVFLDSDNFVTIESYNDILKHKNEIYDNGMNRILL